MPLGNANIPKSMTPTTSVKSMTAKTMIPRPPTGFTRAKNMVTTTDAATLAGGVANPYGAGASAYEPNTEVYVPLEDKGVDNPLLKGYDDAYNAVQESKAKESESAVTASLASATAAVSAGGTGKTMTGSNPTAAVGVKGMNVGTGTVQNIISAANSMVGKYYVWGGTTSAGVDCSGLIYYAFRQAGINIPRYRAVDYGKMGQQVTADEARPGDLVYWDEAGDTDHVGIYIGNGQVIQSPQTGQKTAVSKVWGNATYRRILDDGAFGTAATPTGTTVSYNGAPVQQMVQRTVSLSSPVQFKKVT